MPLSTVAFQQLYWAWLGSLTEEELLDESAALRAMERPVAEPYLRISMIDNELSRRAGLNRLH